jgi:hypothetical protein
LETLGKTLKYFNINNGTFSYWGSKKIYGTQNRHDSEYIATLRVKERS